MPVFCVQEPQIPLLLSKAANLSKLFLADVGLLASMYADGLQLKVLSRETDINFGCNHILLAWGGDKKYGIVFEQHCALQ